MEFRDTIRKRAMVRSFSSEPVDRAIADALLTDALRSPTAGNTGGTAWVVLEGPEETGLYFDATTDEQWRREHRDWDEGLRRAPWVMLAYASPEAYATRYGEPDKVASRLGDGSEHWPVPYWFGDAAFGVMALLLGAVDAGLGACVLGSFRGEAELARVFGIPDAWCLFCAVVLGHPDGKGHRSASLDRRGFDGNSRIHRGRW